MGFADRIAVAFAACVSAFAAGAATVAPKGAGVDVVESGGVARIRFDVVPDTPFMLGNYPRVGADIPLMFDRPVHGEGSAVHSDMLRWNDAETPENAQRFVLNSLFGVVQYSVMLRDASPEMRRMVGKWIDFSREHRDTLLKGEFRPHFPHLNYPVIEAESARERIVVVYDPCVSFDLGPVMKPTYVIDGVTGRVARKDPERGRR